MSSNKNGSIKWYEVYSFLAELLVLFYEKYDEKASEKLYGLLDNDDDFKSNNDWFQKFKQLEHTAQKDDEEITKRGCWIDPMHLFVSINVNSLKIDLRIKRIDTLIKILRTHLEKDGYEELIKGIDKNFKKGIQNGFYHLLINSNIVVKDDFDKKSYWDLEDQIKSVFYYRGCPMTQPSKALQPRPLKIIDKEKKIKIIDNDLHYYEKRIWKVFYEIKNTRKIEKKFPKLKELNIEEFKEVNGIGFILISIFLYWIDYQYFLPLDKNTIQFLKERRKLTTEPKQFDESYKELLQKGNSNKYLSIKESKKIFPFITSETWKKPKDQIDLIEEKKDDNEENLRKLLVEYGLKPRTIDDNGFQIIGLKVLKKIEKRKGSLVKLLKEKLKKIEKSDSSLIKSLEEKFENIKESDSSLVKSLEEELEKTEKNNNFLIQLLKEELEKIEKNNNFLIKLLEEKLEKTEKNNNSLIKSLKEELEKIEKNNNFLIKSLKEIKEKSGSLIQLLKQVLENIKKESNSYPVKSLKKDLKEIEKSSNSLIKLINQVLEKIEKENSHLVKSLKVDEPYMFYKAYTIEGDEIKYDKTINTDIYHHSSIPINISAIVGKNGTGKSTLTELLFIAVNNLYIALSNNKKNNDDDDDVKPEYVNNLHIEIYLKITFLYKITFGEGKYLKIERYNQYDGEKYSKIVPLYEWNKDGKEILNEDGIEDLSQFFTLNINYSIYGLNTKHDDTKWLKPVMENGNYTFPIILNPYKNEGNIDINTEEEELKQRLVLNLLNVDNFQSESETRQEDSYNFLQVTETQKAETITFELKENSSQNEDDSSNEESLENIENIYKAIIEVFLDKHDIKRIFERRQREDGSKFQKDAIEDLFESQKITEYLPIWKEYIQKELIELVKLGHYKMYRSYLYEKNDTKEKQEKVIKFIKRIYNNPNHFTFRIRRAIYFVKFYDKIFDQKSIEGEGFTLKKLSGKLNGLVKDRRKHTLQDLIPPPFFDIDIGLKSESEEKNLPLNRLSSGEKQKIYSISSIFYHIQNLDSINTSSSQMATPYRYVNIIFDEIELYFHPDLQRKYINDLLKALKKLPLEHILGINIIFITHSPFILSDIPKSNILFLRRKGDKVISEEGVQTFSANIHELLSTSFFMDNTIGEFAVQQIRKIVEFHDNILENQGNERKTNRLREQYKKNKSKYYHIQSIIGEPYLAGGVKNHLTAIEKLLETKPTIEEKIKQLEEQLNQLKNINQE